MANNETADCGGPSQTKIYNFFKSKETIVSQVLKPKENSDKTNILNKLNCKKSFLWQFFEKKLTEKSKKDVAKCNLCETIVSLGGSGRTAYIGNILPIPLIGKICRNRPIRPFYSKLN